MTIFYHAVQLPLFPSKVCTKCNKEKLLSEFSSCKSKKDGHQTRCKDCQSLIGREYYEAHLKKPAKPPQQALLFSKVCFRCHQEKLLDEFSRKADKKGGYLAHCKQCSTKPSRYPSQDEWTRRNAEYVKNYKQQWYLSNHEHQLQARRTHYLANKEQHQEWSRLYLRTHPEKFREFSMRRKARKMATTIGKVDYLRILEQHGYLCHICNQAIDPKDLEFDHVIPLARGGSHTEDNIKPSHGVCNNRKHTRLMEELTDWHRQGPP